MIAGLSAEQVARDNGDLAVYLRGLETAVSKVKVLAGGGDSQSNTPATAPTIDPPAAATWTVSGQDGQFIIDVLAPGEASPDTQTQAASTASVSSSGVLYQLQSATTLNFDAAGNVQTYGGDSGDPRTHYEIPDPNQTKYWRFRASFQNSDWGEWVYWIDPALCGVVAVWSGLARNSSDVINNAASTPQGTNPCTQHGTSTTIDVASSIWKCGDQTINYNSGSVDPGAYGKWLIYAKDQKRAGGTVTFLATQTNSDITASNDNIFFGEITTSAGGGGTGGGAGGGTCCKAGVTYRMHDGSDKDCSLLQVGDVLMGVDGGPEVIQRIAMIPNRPCFHIEFDVQGKLSAKQLLGNFTVYAIELDRTHTFLAGHTGVIDGACSTHVIQYAGGGWVTVFDAVVSEPFVVTNGAIGSHNTQKDNSL